MHTCEALFKWKKRRASISRKTGNGFPLHLLQKENEIMIDAEILLTNTLL